MTRVLHLLTAEGPVPDASLPALIADAARHEPAEHHTLLLGGGSLRDAADAAGLTPYTLLPEPAGLTRLTLPINRRLIGLLDAGDRVDAWTAQAADLAHRAGASALQLRFHPQHRLRLADRVADTARLKHADRAALRERWGVTDHDHVLALVGRPGNTCDTDRAMMAMHMARGVLDFRGGQHTRLVLLCHPLLPNRREAATALQLSGHGDTVMQEPCLDAPWDILPGCDAALWPDSTAPLPLAGWWAEQAGLPLLTAPTGDVRELADAIARWMSDRPAASAETDRMIPSA